MTPTNRLIIGVLLVVTSVWVTVFYAIFSVAESPCQHGHHEAHDVMMSAWHGDDLIIYPSVEDVFVCGDKDGGH